MSAKLNISVFVTVISTFISCKTGKKTGSGLADTGLNVTGKACAEAAKCSGAVECLKKEGEIRKLEKGELEIAAKLTRYMVLLFLEDSTLTNEQALAKAQAELGLTGTTEGGLKYEGKSKELVDAAIASKKASVIKNIVGLSQEEKQKISDDYKNRLDDNADLGNVSQSAEEFALNAANRSAEARDYLAMAALDATPSGKALFAGMAATALSSQSRLVAAGNGDFSETVEIAKLIQVEINNGLDTMKDATMRDAFDSAAEPARFELARVGVVVGVMATTGTAGEELAVVVKNVYGGNQEVANQASVLSVATFAAREAEIISKSSSLNVSETPKNSIAGVLRQITEARAPELSFKQGETLEVCMTRASEVVNRNVAGSEKVAEEAKKENKRIVERTKH